MDQIAKFKAFETITSKDREYSNHHPYIVDDFYCINYINDGNNG